MKRKCVFKKMNMFISCFVVVFCLLFLTQFTRSQDNLVTEIKTINGVEYFRNTSVEDEVISGLNNWRIRRGLTPLSRNHELDDLALLQAEYRVQFAPFQGVPSIDIVYFHEDQYGDGPRERAILADWEPYEFPGQVQISEIAAYFPSVDDQINFWQSSPIHRQTVEIKGFRELGVVVLQVKNYYLTYVVLGSRPHILPVTYDPDRNILHLSADYFFTDLNYQPVVIQILDRYGNRLHETEWLPWGTRINLPEGATDEIIIRYSNYFEEVTTVVNLYDARIYPSKATPTPTLIPTATPTLPPVFLTPTATYTPAPLPTSTPTPNYDQFDIRLIYDATSFTLLNQSGKPLNLAPMEIMSDIMTFNQNAEWLGRYYNDSPNLVNFPSGFCLQIWSHEFDFVSPPLPDGCNYLASGRSNLSAASRFWLVGSFTVTYYDIPIASCSLNVNPSESLGEPVICEFDLP